MSSSIRVPAPPVAPAIRDLPSEERPRERLRDYGAVQLSNAELIAILLRTGQAGENAVAFATRILSRFDGLNGVARASYSDLCSQRGLSDAKACQLLAALELGRRGRVTPRRPRRYQLAGRRGGLDFASHGGPRSGAS